MEKMKGLPIQVCFATLFLLQSCTKEGDASTGSGGATDRSPAAKMSGIFIGVGKYLPANISLGNTLACTAPPKDYNSFYQTGIATISVAKLTDSTVKIQFLSGPFPVDGYPIVKVSESGNTVQFLQGSYDINSRAISFSAVAPGYSYSYSVNCKLGLPFYTSTIGPGSTGLMEYSNYTIKRYEFGGTRQ